MILSDNVQRRIAEYLKAADDSYDAYTEVRILIPDPKLRAAAVLQVEQALQAERRQAMLADKASDPFVDDEDREEAEAELATWED